MINHTDMKNSKTEMNNSINTDDFADKCDFDMMILRCLNHNEIDLYSDTAQTMIFCFQRLFVMKNEMLIADLMKNIDEISWQYCHNSDSVICYFIVHSY